MRTVSVGSRGRNNEALEQGPASIRGAKNAMIEMVKLQRHAVMYVLETNWNANRLRTKLFS